MEFEFLSPQEPEDDTCEMESQEPRSAEILGEDLDESFLESLEFGDLDRYRIRNAIGIPPGGNGLILGRDKRESCRLVPPIHPAETIDMAAAVPLCNTYIVGTDGKRRKARKFSVEGHTFHVMGIPSVDSATWRLAGRPHFRSDKMHGIEFLPKRDDVTGEIVRWYQNFDVQPYFESAKGRRTTVSLEWYYKWGTWLDIAVKSLTRYHYGTSRKSFPDYRSYLYALSMLQLLYKEATGYSGPDFGFDALLDRIARLDIALNLQFLRKRDALAFVEWCKGVRIPHMVLTSPEDLPNAEEKGVKNGTGIYS